MKHFSCIYKQTGHSLIELCISLAISLAMLGVLLHFAYKFQKLAHNLQRKIEIQNAKLFSYYYLSTDVRNSGYKANKNIRVCQASRGSCLGLLPQSVIGAINKQQIKPRSDVMILYIETGAIIYFLRQSVLHTHHKPKYALYRQKWGQKSVAIVENILNFKVELKSDLQNILFAHIQIQYADLEQVVFKLRPRNNKV